VSMRPPPAAIDAEQQVLGSLMLVPESMAKIGDWLTPEDFYRRDHRLIFTTIRDLLARNKPVDCVTMADWFVANNLADQVGGTAYVYELGNTQGSAANIVAHAEIVREKSLLRSLIQTGTEAVNTGFECNGVDAQTLVADTMRKLTKLSLTDRNGGLEPVKPMLRSWFDLLRARWESGDKMTGLVTPWKLVNDLTFGLQPADLIVVGARPAMGKSVLGFNLAAFTALRGDRTALFSLEMSSEQVMQRMVSALYEIPHDWLRSPASSEDDHWPSVTLGMRDIGGSQLLVDDTPALTMAQITARAKRAHAQSPLRLVVVDHLHIVKRAGKNVVEEIGEISRGLKALAKSLHCPVVALAQLNRGPADQHGKGGTGREPTLTDLRASGDIEQDADVIFLMHRKDYYAKSVLDHDGSVELIVGKGRNMPQGQTLTLKNRYDVMRLDDWRGPLPSQPVADSKPARKFRRPDGRWAATGDN